MQSSLDPGKKIEEVVTSRWRDAWPSRLFEDEAFSRSRQFSKNFE